MTTKELTSIIGGIAPVVREYVTVAHESHSQAIARLEARVKELEFLVNQAGTKQAPSATRGGNQSLADMIVLTIKAALGPVLERISALETKVSQAGTKHISGDTSSVQGRFM